MLGKTLVVALFAMSSVIGCAAAKPPVRMSSSPVLAQVAPQGPLGEVFGTLVAKGHAERVGPDYSGTLFLRTQSDGGPNVWLLVTNWGAADLSIFDGASSSKVEMTIPPHSSGILMIQLKTVDYQWATDKEGKQSMEWELYANPG